jgi:hypothetical protein
MGGLCCSEGSAEERDESTPPASLPLPLPLPRHHIPHIKPLLTSAPSPPPPPALGLLSSSACASFADCEPPTAADIDWQRDFDPVAWSVEETADVLGEGSFGIVRRVHHPRYPHVSVAVKCIQSASRLPPNDPTRFATRVEEVHANVEHYAHSMHHPNVLRIYATHWSPNNDTLYIVMQLARPFVWKRKTTNPSTYKSKGAPMKRCAQQGRGLFRSASCSALAAAAAHSDCHAWLKHMQEAIQGKGKHSL